MYPSKKPYFNTENPVVRDELWDDGDSYDYDDDYDDAEFWFSGRRVREPDWDKMPDGYDYLNN